jgi:hypothetical protein
MLNLPDYVDSFARMELVIIFGPPAVGKMAKGMALEKKTGLKLFHNHMSIEFVQPFFNYGTSTGRRLVGEFRQRIFEEVANSNLKGLIFTYVWAFNLESEKEYIDSICHLFQTKGARVSFVELKADLPIRIERNKSELRLAHKNSKRDLQWSHENLLKNETHKMNTDGDFYYPDILLKIDNSNLSAEAVAEKIISHFHLE